MATIILNPKEIFEHFHSEKSSTTLLEGQALYKCGDVSIVLSIKQTIYTSANKSHTVENLGNDVCIFSCGHGAGGGGEH